jgi:putative ABC transport system permease protein
MLKNFLKVSARALSRHKAFTAITVVGLSLSMAVCLLILAFVWDQTNYDAFHAHEDRIYRVLTDRVRANGDVDAFAATPAPLADVLVREVPGIEAITRIGQIRAQAVYEGKAVPVEGLYAEPSFFDIFSFTLERGDPYALLGQPDQLILSPEAATRVFGTQDPMGRTLTLEGYGTFIVGGILAEPPGPSHLQFDVLAPFAAIQTSPRAEELTDWMNSWRFATYLLVEEPSVVERLEAVLPRISERQYAGEDEQLLFHTQALDDIALGPALGNEISSYSIPAIMAYLLAALGAIIMLAAGFNYVSLSVARSMRRAREVGVRKTVGARRGQVVLQFLTEAVLVSLLSLVIALVLLTWLVPAFNQLTFVQMLGAAIPLERLFDVRLLGWFVLFSAVIGVLAGIYPALRLSRFQPAVVLKGTHAAGGFSGRRLRFGLAGTQFGVALLLVTVTVLLFAQARHLLHADYGFAQENVLSIALQGQKLEVLHTELQRHPAISEVAATSQLPASGSTSRIAVHRDGLADRVPAFQYAIDPDFLRTLDLRLIAGRNLSSAIASDTAAAVLLNATAVERLHLGSPAEAVGTYLDLGGGESPRTVQVVGVVEDYHYNTMLDPIDALVLHYTPSQFRYALVQVQPGAVDAAMAHVDAVWERLDPVHAAEYRSLDTHLSDGIVHRIVRDISSIIGLVALLAVVVSCLGLLGMALYTVETRTKEVGLRKVLGASRRSLVLLLSREYLLLILVAAAVVLPLAWLLNRTWLQVFASHITLQPWMLVGCGVLTALLALAVITTQTLRAASADPVHSLRHE